MRISVRSTLVLGAAAGLSFLSASPARATPPPFWAGIGTSVDDVYGDGSGVAFATSVSDVTHSPPALVHRHGLDYLETTGVVSGIGWGGEWEDLSDPFAERVDANVHYAYAVPYVLRWTAGWDGTLVVYGHGRGSLGLLAFADSFLGAANEGRALEHEGDFVSDAVVAPAQGHAYFAANLNGLASDGSFSVLGLEPPFEGEPLKVTLDVPLARDLVAVAKGLLATLSGRSAARVVATGHSAGALVAQWMDGGVSDSPNTGLLTFTGGDFVVPYDPDSGTVVQAFVPLAGGNWRIHPAFPMAAPMLMIGGLSETSAVDSVRYARRLRVAGVDLNAAFRTYQVRDLPHSWAEIVESTPNLDAFLADLFGVVIHADGDRMQPVAGAVIEAAVALLKRGVPPPRSRIDGVGVDTDAVPGPDAVGFAQASGPPTILVPSVYDPVLDVYDGYQDEFSVAGGFPNAVPRYLEILGVLDHGPALSLPKVACRLGGFRVSEMLSDCELIPFDFAANWKNAGACTACVKKAVDALAAEGLYLRLR
jgi:hypothetical protein